MIQRLLVALSFVCVTVVGASIMASTAVAQDISGSVQDAKSGKKLAGVTIAIKGGGGGAISDKNGAFRVKVTKEVTLLASYIGYKPVTVQAQPGASDLVIKMDEDVLKTSEIVVTGLASSVKKANSPTSIGTINEKELLPAPAQTVDQAFAGKFAGVSIRQNTGAPGGGMSVTMRGATTLIGGSQPLYIVDGVIVNNNTYSGGQNAVTGAAAGGAATGASQEQSVNRIADINPNDIEDIQVLKGPSAAAAYGAKAASGVVIIKTKQGRAGKMNVTFSQQIGANTLLKKLGLRRFNNEQEVAEWNPDFVPVWRDAASKGNTFIDNEELLYGNTGLVVESDINVRGGNEMTQYNLGGTYRSDQGIIKNTSFERLAARMNINHSFSDRLTARIGLNYIRSRSERGFTGNSNGDNVSIIYGVSVIPSFFDVRRRADGTYPDLQGLNPSNPYEIVDRVKNTEQINRMIASANLNWSIIKTEEHTLDFVFQGGADFTSQRNLIYDPANTLHQIVKPQAGLYGVSDAGILNSNMFLTLVHRYDAGNGLSFTTQGGVQFENQSSNSVVNVSQGFPSLLENLSGAAVQQSLQTVIYRYDQGFYLQEDVDIFGKFFLTASVRADRSSANGDASRYFIFPKVAGSMQFNQFDFWKDMQSILPAFKLRAAYGEAGTPVNSIAAKYSLLSTQNNNLAGLGVGLANLARVGNPDIRPERTSELEFGTDFVLGDNIASVEMSYFRKYSRDLILSRNLPTSSGFTNIFANVGEMENIGFEAQLNINAVRTEGFSWIPRLNFFTNRAVITKLDVPPFNSGGFGAGYGANRVQQGLSATAIMGRQNFGPRFPGDTVRAGVYNGTTPAGDANPTFQIGFGNTFKIGNLEIYFLLDWRQGNSVVNLTQALYAEGGLWKSKAESDSIVARASRSVPAGGFTPYIQDGSFVKLREASLSYSFTKDMLAGGFLESLEFVRVGLAGRNLLMFTSYQGYDPEVSNFGNIVTQSGQDVAPFPSSRSFFFNLSVGF